MKPYGFHLLANIFDNRFIARCPTSVIMLDMPCF